MVAFKGAGYYFYPTEMLTNMARGAVYFGCPTTRYILRTSLDNFFKVFAQNLQVNKLPFSGHCGLGSVPILIFQEFFEGIFTNPTQTFTWIEK